MNQYELEVFEEVQEWKRKLLKRHRLVKRLSQKVQGHINKKIPENIHGVLTESIKNIVHFILTGSGYLTKFDENHSMSLKERDKRLAREISIYRKAATIEGAGTGAGGLLLGLADFPLLLSIKFKFLFEAAKIYGFNTNEYSERLFILYIFRLAYSNIEKRADLLKTIETWDEMEKELMSVCWQEFQQEYRDYIDFVKMLQLVPGIGAVVGAYANYNLLEHLGETAKNAYRIRILNAPPKLY